VYAVLSPANTVHALDYRGDPAWRRLIIGQADRGEGRHDRPGKGVFRGREGELRQLGPLFGFANLACVGATSDVPRTSGSARLAEDSSCGVERGPLRPQERFAGIIPAGGCSTLSSLNRRGVTESGAPSAFQGPLLLV
jgi:hypothetical protein